MKGDEGALNAQPCEPVPVILLLSLNLEVNALETTTLSVMPTHPAVDAHLARAHAKSSSHSERYPPRSPAGCGLQKPSAVSLGCRETVISAAPRQRHAFRSLHAVVLDVSLLNQRLLLLYT